MGWLGTIRNDDSSGGGYPPAVFMVQRYEKKLTYPNFLPIIFQIFLFFSCGDYKVLNYKAYSITQKASLLWSGKDYSPKTLINESDSMAHYLCPPNHWFVICIVQRTGVGT